MNLQMSIYFAILFFVLSPGVLVSLPNDENKYVTAGVHAVVFALVYTLTHKYVWKMLNGNSEPSY